MRFLLPAVILTTLSMCILSGACASSKTSDTECFPPPKGLEGEMRAAMNARDIAAITRVTTEIRKEFPIPTPEVPEQYVNPGPEAEAIRFTGSELKAAAERYLADVRAESWWLWSNPPQPPEIPKVLRVPAGMIRGALAVGEAFPELKAEALSLAVSAADYLLQASKEAGFPGAPFPYWRGKPGRLGYLSERKARMLENCGKLEQCVVNGWFVVPMTPEDYYFDTGLVGEALGELYAETKDPRYRQWLTHACAWAREQPLSPNFNYNAFLIHLFCRAYRSSGDEEYLNLAVDRARWGVLPGMIKEREYEGHWIEPHNERIAYRVIMGRALIRLSTTLAVAKERKLFSRGVDFKKAASVVLKAVEEQMYANGGVTSVKDMVDLYCDLEVARAAGVDLLEPNPKVRLNIVAHIAEYIRAGQAGETVAVGRLLKNAAQGGATGGHLLQR